jgi:hypothetical protein
MTNTENPTPVFAPVDFSAPWQNFEMSYRVLNWLSYKGAFTAYNVDITKFSTSRQIAVADLVTHGLVSQATWTGGEDDGRVTYRLTALGELRLNQAWHAAAVAVTAEPSMAEQAFYRASAAELQTAMVEELFDVDPETDD